MVPANECFETLYCSSYGVHNRLIGEMELVFLQRFTQGDFQNAAFLGMNMQLWFIRMMQPAAMFLRTVESKVRPAHQHSRCSSVPRRNGSAHARSIVKCLLIHPIRARQSLDKERKTTRMNSSH